MMKRVALKIENANDTYTYYYSASEVALTLYRLCYRLKPNQAVSIKLGNKHQYIDYKADKEYDYDINRVMYYVRLHLD